MGENIRYTTKKGIYCMNEELYLVPCDDAFRKFYTWTGAKNACPAGWVLPSKMDFDALFAHLKAQGDPKPGAVLKSQEGWPQDLQGTDEYGMSILPWGYIADSSLSAQETEADFWTRTYAGTNEAWMYTFYATTSSDQFYVSDTAKYAVGVRCIKEESSAQVISCDTLGENDICDARDGTWYKATYLFGGYIMAENLRYVDSTGSWCYQNDPSNCIAYGRLYDWDAAMRSCPSGWHIPTEEDWSEMTPYDSSDMGKYLKSTSALHWGNGVGDDYYRTRFLPGGLRNEDATFAEKGTAAYFWSAGLDSSINPQGNPWYHYVKSTGDTLFHSSVLGKNAGLSVRCRKDP
jgi:uncharacterized protein (TIGR02145 family)